jgi:TatD DNase family protein
MADQQLALTDTHCHIHEAQDDALGDAGTRSKWLSAGRPDPDVMIAAARSVGVTRLICVGTTVPDSDLATDFAARRDNVWSSVGIHPHETDSYLNDDAALAHFTELTTRPSVVAVGECGLDYFYKHASKQAQQQLLRFQIETALTHGLPMIFHVREAFADFWPIFDEYKGIHGVIHSFSSDTTDLEQILSRGLYVGLNGIMTFTKQPEQLAAAKAAPLGRLLLETDAPFLTPAPQRGKVCEPKHVRVTAEFLSHLRGESLAVLAAATTRNAQTLFNFSDEAAS